MTNFVSQITLLVVVVIALVIILKFDSHKESSGFFRGFLKQKKIPNINFEKAANEGKGNSNVTAVHKGFVPKLLVYDAKEIQEYAIESEGLKVGRALDNDIVIKHNTVSQYAFEISQDDNGYFFNIINQKYVYDKEQLRLDTKENVKSISLEDGTQIYFGECCFRFESPDIALKDPFLQRGDTMTRQADPFTKIKRMS